MTNGDSYEYNADPVAAMTFYANSMHIHTKKQMEAAKRAFRRRSGDATVEAQNTLQKEASIDSTSSASTGSSRMSY